MNDLLFVDRIVLESLDKSPRNYEELSADTGLNISILMSVLNMLTNNNIIIEKAGYYQLNLRNKLSWLKDINSRDHIKEELKDYMVAHVNKYFKDSNHVATSDSILHFTKVWMSPWEEKELNLKVESLMNFIKKINLSNKTRKTKISKKICQKRVIFLGHSKYDELVNNMLEVV